MTKYFLVILTLTVTLYSCKTGGAGESEVMETSGGYKYQTVNKGGGEKAVLGNYAYFNAEVVSLEGDVVFSSEETGQPGIMKLVEAGDPQNPSPFSEILLNGNVGDSVHIFLGAEQGAQGSGYDSLIYKIGFFDMVDQAEYENRMEQEQAETQKRMEAAKEVEKEIAAQVQDIYSGIKSGKYDAETQTTDSGLKYIIHEKGDGALPTIGDNVSVNYYGVRSENGEVFDNSWKRGQSFRFPLGKGRVIKGWDEGVALLPKGSKATLIIPGDLGYGERGSGIIQPNDELIFYIEVDK